MSARPDIASLDGTRYDILIIGGGISGCSAAQHLAAAGYSLLLVEKGDFASAATGRSSRLLHCGLRYLAPARSPAEFLVRPDKLWTAVSMAVRSLRTRREFLAASPERLRVLDMAIPVYRGAAYPGWQVDLGAAMLGALNLGGPALNYWRRKPKAAAAAHPLVARLRAPETLASVFGFRDYQFHWPERIAIDAAMAAERRDSVLRNYTEATHLERQADGGWRAMIEDRRRPGAKARVEGRMLLNLAGVWVDDVNRKAAPDAPPSRKIVAVKGAHIAVRLPDECRGFGIAGLNTEGEHIFCLPWGDLHYLGPTETVYEGDLEDVRPDESDIAFLLEEINHMMPALELKRGDVELAWAGARPITYDPDRAKGRRMPFSVLHDLGREGMGDALAVTWAAIMFHRPTARKLVKRVRAKLRPSGTPVPVTYTSESFPDNTNAPPLVSDCPNITTATLRHVAEREHPDHLVDILFRRTGLGWRTRVPEEAARRAAETVADILGWDEARIAQETAAYRAHVRAQHLQN
jgi:glycerol-3-phosphate dehydrogenase